MTFWFHSFLFSKHWRISLSVSQYSLRLLVFCYNINNFLIIIFFTFFFFWCENHCFKVIINLFQFSVTSLSKFCIYFLALFIMFKIRTVIHALSKFFEFLSKQCFFFIKVYLTCFTNNLMSSLTIFANVSILFLNISSKLFLKNELINHCLIINVDINWIVKNWIAFVLRWNVFVYVYIWNLSDTFNTVEIVMINDVYIFSNVVNHDVNSAALLKNKYKITDETQDCWIAWI